MSSLRSPLRRLPLLRRPWLRRPKPANPPIEEVAAITQRLAVLLAAGVSPVSAWGYLLPRDGDQDSRASEPAESVGRRRRRRAGAGRAAGRRSGRSTRRGTRGAGDTHETVDDEPLSVRVIRAAALAGPRGDSIADAIALVARDAGGQSGDAWLGLAAAWRVATDAGAPLAGSLRELAASFRDLGQVQRDLGVALAGPNATARMVMMLPVVGIGFGALMGFNSLATLFGTVPGVVCLVVGSALMFAGSRWNRRLVRSAQPKSATPGLHLDLVAIGMAGGGSVERARGLVVGTIERYGLGDAGAGAGGDAGGRAVAEESSGEVIDRVLELSTRAGVPAAELLRSEAEQVRRDARSAGQRNSETLAVSLMIPLGVCVLPAFMLVGVAPLLMTVLSSTFSTL